MKTIARLLLILSLASLAPVAAQTQTSSIEGVIVDLVSGVPVPKVTLDLQMADNSSVRYPGVTTADGKFVFRGVVPGRYSLVAMRTGYVRAQYGQRGPNSNASTLTVTAGQRITDVRLSMVRSGAISGRLIDTEGEPVSEAQVHAWRITYADGWRVLTPVTSLASNDLGEFRLFGLPPGQYYISAQPEPPDYIRGPSFNALGPVMPGAIVTSFSAGQGGAGLGDPATQSRRVLKDWTPIYFGGATDPLAATPIDLPPGNEIRNADITIERVSMVQLSGNVVDSNGAPATNVRITLTPNAANMPFAASRIVNVTGGKIALSDSPLVGVAPNGELRSDSLPRAAYMLTAVANTPNGRMSGQAIVDLRNATAGSTRITVTPARTLSGQVVVDGSPATAPDLSRVRVGLRSLAAASMDIAPKSPSPTGAFSIPEVLAGDYLFNVSSTIEKSYVKSIRAGDVDLLEDGLHGTRLPDGEVRIVIGANAGELRGIAVDENGAPMSNVTVVLMPEENRRHRLDLYQSATTDTSGAYRFDRVPPGTFKLFAWEDVEKDAWRDSLFMRQHESRGQTVQVGEGAAQTSNVAVIRVR
jgi:hypothetical protein